MTASQTIIARKRSNQRITVKKNEKRTLIVPFFQGSEKKRHIIVTLANKGAEIDVIGFIIGKGDATFPFEIQVIHKSPRTNSNTEIRSVLNENACADIHGMVKIEKNARKTDAYFAAHTLLMSENAHTRTLPAFEIKTNDVKASHAASTGKMDPEMLFYIRARGINEKEAKQIMVKSFLEQGLQKIEDGKLREKIRKMLFQHL